MEIFGLSIKGTIKPNVRVLIIPSVLIGSLVILSLVVFKNGYLRISTQIKQLRDAEQIENTLTTKIDTLQQIRGIALDQADKVVIAVPEKNPAIMMLAQLNFLANDYSLIVENKVVNPPRVKEGELSTVKILFSIEGELLPLIGFLKGINNLTPLSSIESANIALRGNIARIEVAITTYFGEFPTKIPPITQPITTLTDQEKVQLEKLSALKEPEFIELDPTQPDKREDPFN